MTFSMFLAFVLIGPAGLLMPFRTSFVPGFGAADEIARVGLSAARDHIIGWSFPMRWRPARFGMLAHG